MKYFFLYSQESRGFVRVSGKQFDFVMSSLHEKIYIVNKFGFEIYCSDPDDDLPFNTCYGLIVRSI